VVIGYTLVLELNHDVIHTPRSNAWTLVTQIGTESDSELAGCVGKCDTDLLRHLIRVFAVTTSVDTATHAAEGLRAEEVGLLPYGLTINLGISVLTEPLVEEMNASSDTDSRVTREINVLLRDIHSREVTVATEVLVSIDTTRLTLSSDGESRGGILCRSEPTITVLVEVIKREESPLIRTTQRQSSTNDFVFFHVCPGSIAVVNVKMSSIHVCHTKVGFMDSLCIKILCDSINNSVTQHTTYREEKENNDRNCEKESD